MSMQNCICVGKKDEDFENYFYYYRSRLSRMTNFRSVKKKLKWSSFFVFPPEERIYVIDMIFRTKKKKVLYELFPRRKKNTKTKEKRAFSHGKATSVDFRTTTTMMTTKSLIWIINTRRFRTASSLALRWYHLLPQSNADWQGEGSMG